MARRRVWLTVVLVAVTLATAVLAVMANTGLLTFDRPERPVGRLTPADVSVAPVRVQDRPSTLQRHHDGDQDGDGDDD